MMNFRNMLTQIKRITMPKRYAFRSAVKLAFSKHLLLTNTITSGALMFVGDIVQQEIEYQRKMLPKRYNWRRLTIMTIVGIGYGPLHHYFYLGIDKIWPVRDMASVMKKILSDQFIMAPACIAYFFYFAGMCEFRHISDSTKELREKFLEVYTVDWLIWPPTQFINFYFLPVQYQVLYINGITTVYNVFLSYIKYREEAHKHLEETKLKGF